MFILLSLPALGRDRVESQHSSKFQHNLNAEYATAKSSSCSLGAQDSAAAPAQSSLNKQRASLGMDQWRAVQENRLSLPLSGRSASLTIDRVNQNPSLAIRWAKQSGQLESLFQVEHQSLSRLTPSGDRSLSVGLSRASLSLKQSSLGELGGHFQFDKNQRSWGIYAEAPLGAKSDLRGRLSYQQSGGRTLEQSQFGLRLSSSNTCLETQLDLKQHRSKVSSQQRVESLRSKLRQKLGPDDSVELSMEMCPNSLMSGSKKNPSLNRALQLTSLRLGYDRRLARDVNWSTGVRVKRLQSGQWVPEVQTDLNWQW